MAQLLIRDLEEDVKESLRARADRHGNSMEEEARRILRSALLRASDDEDFAGGLGTEILEMFRPFDLPKGTFNELRGSGGARPAPFKEENDE